MDEEASQKASSEVETDRNSDTLIIPSTLSHHLLSVVCMCMVFGRKTVDTETE